MYFSQAKGCRKIPAKSLVVTPNSQKTLELLFSFGDGKRLNSLHFSIQGPFSDLLIFREAHNSTLAEIAFLQIVTPAVHARTPVPVYPCAIPTYWNHVIKVCFIVPCTPEHLVH